MSYLKLQKQDKSRRTVRVRLCTDEAVTIGRVPSCTMHINDPSVSRKHAVVSWDTDHFVLVDSGSTGGTFLNSSLLTAPALLKDSDVIRVGGAMLTVELSDAAKTPPTAKTMASASTAEDELPLIYSEWMMGFKREVHETILGKLNLSKIATRHIEDDALRNRLEQELDATLRERRHELPSDAPIDTIRQAIMDELIAFGPITPLLRDDSISEIMVNGPSTIFIEVNGKIQRVSARFFDSRHLISVIQRIVEPLGRHVDEGNPMVDARLPDGSRVNVVIPPLSLNGPTMTIRKFASKKLELNDLIALGSVTEAMAMFLREATRVRKNILIAGGTGSGKTTLLNVISGCIPVDERLVTIEDSAELKLTQENLVKLEARPANIEGRGQVTIRDLVMNALRMRPDRIIVGECRGAEAFDMLQAMNTGHDGSLTTVHANTPRDAIMRLENMVMMAGFDLPVLAIREQIASAIDIVVQQQRLIDGSRKIVAISEVTGREGDVITMQDIFVFTQTGFTPKGGVQGEFRATGNMPRFIEDLRKKQDLQISLDIFDKTATGVPA